MCKEQKQWSEPVEGVRSIYLKSLSDECYENSIKYVLALPSIPCIFLVKYIVASEYLNMLPTVK